MPHRAWIFVAILTLMMAFAIGVAARDDTQEAEKQATGAFTCDFALPADFPQSAIGPSIERDRMYMAARPGMLHKHIPFSLDPMTGNIFSGGRYLFDTALHASQYKEWVFNSYNLDGILFFNRPYFLHPECHAWEVIGAHDFQDIHSSQIVLRTERWAVPPASQRDMLREKFTALLAQAQMRGLTSVWLLYNQDEALVSLVYFWRRVAQRSPHARRCQFPGTRKPIPPRRDLRRSKVDANV
jgi:hypothetical protein